MALPSTGELQARMLTWLDDDHPECESGVDLLVALLEEVGLILDEHRATAAEYGLVVACCLELLFGNDAVTAEMLQDIVTGCEKRLGVTIRPIRRM